MEIEMGRIQPGEKSMRSEQTAFCPAGRLRPVMDPCERCIDFPGCRDRGAYPDNKLSLCPAFRIVRANRPCKECQEFGGCSYAQKVQ